MCLLGVLSEGFRRRLFSAEVLVHGRGQRPHGVVDVEDVAEGVAGYVTDGVDVRCGTTEGEFILRSHVTALREPVRREERGVWSCAGGVDVDVYVSGSVVGEMEGRVCGFALGGGR